MSAELDPDAVRRAAKEHAQDDDLWLRPATNLEARLQAALSRHIRLGGASDVLTATLQGPRHKTRQGTRRRRK